jgi:hypothetical protein
MRFKSGTKSTQGLGTKDRRRSIDIRTSVLVYSTTDTICKHNNRNREVIWQTYLTNEGFAPPWLNIAIYETAGT